MGLKKIAPKNLSEGFTLIELMIVVAIVGVLAAVAIPQYSNYVVKSKLASVLHAIASVKTAVGACAQEGNGSFDTCNSGSKNIPSTFAVKDVASVTASKGEITISLLTKIGTGVDGGIIKVVPEANGTNITWITSYTGIDNQVAQEYLKKHN